MHSNPLQDSIEEEEDEQLSENEGCEQQCKFYFLFCDVFNVTYFVQVSKLCKSAKVLNLVSCWKFQH